MTYNIILKWILVGDSYCGKTAILKHFTGQEFKSDSKHTIGIEFGSKIIMNQLVKLQIWDTAGQERYRALTRNYWRSAAGCFLVYDISRRSSFTSLTSWIKDIYKNGNPSMIILLIGNKSDMEEYRQVSTQEGQEFSKKYGILFFETSALTGQNIEKAFTLGSELILSNIEMGLLDPDDMHKGIQYVPDNMGKVIHCREKTKSIVNCFYC